MSSFNIDVESGKTVRLPTGGKYCPKDIVVTAVGGGGGGYDEGYKAGQQAEYDRFWNGQQDNGTRANYYYAYAYAGWNDISFNPKYDIVCDGSDANGENMFYQNYSITRVPVEIVIRGASARQIFYRCTSLRSVKKLVLDGVTDFRNMFTNCTSLEHIILDGGENGIGTSFGLQQSPYLDEESRASIVGSLADMTGKDQQTLTLHATAGGKLTEAQKATITAKNWKLVY